MTPSISKRLCFKNVSRPHGKEKSAFQIPPVQKAFSKIAIQCSLKKKNHNNINGLVATLIRSSHSLVVVFSSEYLQQ